MAFALVLNSSNVISGSYNTRYQYNFIGGGFRAQDMEICISQASIPYAWVNISSAYGNNTFSLILPTGATTQTIAVTLPDGFYSVTDIQNYIQQVLITNLFYLIDGAGNYVFPFLLTYSRIYYKIQLICATIPDAADMATLGYTQPAGAPALPTATTGVQFVVGTIGSVIGYEAGTYPTVATSASQNFLGTLTPVGSTVNSLVFRCSLVDNNISMPSDIMDGCNINTAFGTNIIYNPAFEKWVKVKNGTYSNLILTIVDQNLGQIYSVDPNIAMTLMIRQQK
jgi:hypothetical protein